MAISISSSVTSRARSLCMSTTLSIFIITTLSFASLVGSIRSDYDMDESFKVENSTICPLNPCQGWATNNFSCSQSGCTEVPVEDIHDDIEEIYLGGNNISSVPELPYTFLEHLDLSRNNISVITKGAFEKLIRLVSLNMADNRLNNDTMLLDSNVIARLDKLQRIDLSGNQFESLYDNMFSMSPPASPMLSINISHNRISTMKPNAVNDFKSLTILDLSNNKLTSLHVLQFRGLLRIERIIISNNQLTDVPLVGSLKTLKWLDLSDNQIASINATAFKENRRLASNLEILDLSRNRLVNLEYGSLPLTSLSDIYLDGNKDLVQISDGLFNLSSRLSLISITNCPALSMIGKSLLHPLTHDIRVNISRNSNLIVIDPEAFGGVSSNVVELDLSLNSLVTLTADLLDWSNLVRVDLSGNKWDCDCHLRWIKEIERNATNGTTFAQSIICHTPLHLRGRTFDSVDVSALRCGMVNRYRRHGAVLLAISFTILFIALIVLLVRKCRHRIRAAWFTSVSKYEPLHYNASEAAAATEEDETSSVHITHKRGAETPTPV